MDKLNDAIFITDPGTAKILDVNYRACTTLGYSRAELLNLTVLDIEETITDSSSWAELVSQAGRSGYEFLQCREKRKDGTTFPAEVNANLINWGGRDYMVAMVRDITKREQVQIQLKESETKFRKLAECARDAIIVMGSKGEISFWNPAAEKIFGYSHGEAIGKNLHELLVPERFRDAFYKGFSGFQKTGKGNAVGKTLNLMAIRKDGSEFSIEVSISPVRLEGILHAVGIVRDTSQRMAKETNLDVQCNTAEETAKSIN
jgi:PAS domain S-box-containing protein